MKKILFLANDYSTLYQFRRELIDLLIERGEKVYLSLPYDKRNKYFTSKGCIVKETPVERRGINPETSATMEAFTGSGTAE